MPIELFTGLPGHGKTSLMMEHLMKQAEVGERPLFASGIDGLREGLATPLLDPREWNAKDENGEYVVPSGSLIYIDEAWKWFGHLHVASKQNTPDHVLKLAEHRHRGIDFVWTTQVPGQIYPFARGLIERHHHTVRRFGTQMIDIFSWQELNDDVKSAAKRENAQRSTRALPKQVRGAYKSADEHTIKARVPWKVWLMPIGIITAISLSFLAYRQLTSFGKPDAEGEGAATASAGASPNTIADREKPPATAIEYARAHLPRFSTMLHTAPVYDGRTPTTYPELYCMASDAGQGEDGWRDASVTCLTEQGTRVDLGAAEARTVARYGTPYNAYKPEQREQLPTSADRGVGGTPTAMAQRAVPSSMTTAPGAVVSGDARSVAGVIQSAP